MSHHPPPGSDYSGGYARNYQPYPVYQPQYYHGPPSSSGDPYRLQQPYYAPMAPLQQGIPQGYTYDPYYQSSMSNVADYPPVPPVHVMPPVNAYNGVHLQPQDDEKSHVSKDDKSRASTEDKKHKRKRERGLRSACDFCKKSKHACIRPPTANPQDLAACERCNRLGKACTLNGEKCDAPVVSPLLAQPLTIGSNHSISPTLNSVEVERIQGHDRFFFAQYNVALTHVSSKLYTLAPVDVIGRLVNHFWDNVQGLMPILNRGLFEAKGGWIAQPLLTASLLQVVYSVPRVSSDSSTPGTNNSDFPNLDRQKMLSLAESVFDVVELVLVCALADSRTRPVVPLIPLHQLLDCIKAGMLAAMGWSISPLFFRIWKIHLLTIDVCTKWGLYELDQDSNSVYVKQLWSKDPSPLAFGPGINFPCTHRESVRRIWGNLCLSDTILTSTFDSAPSITPDQAMAMKPPIVESLWVDANVTDEEIGRFEYLCDGLPMKNTRWVAKDLGDKERCQGIKVACGDIKENGPSLFVEVSVIVACMVLSNSEKYALADDTTKEGEDSIAARKKLRDLIDELLNALPEPLCQDLSSGQSDKVMATCFSWFRPSDAVKFVFAVLRLKDMKICLQLQAPLYGVATQFYHMWQQFLRSDGMDAHEDPSLLPLLETISKFRRRPIMSKSLHAATHDMATLTASPRPWLNLYSDTHLESALTDSMTVSWLVRSLHRVLKSTGSAIGTSIIPIVFRMALVHISLFANLAKSRGNPESQGLFVASFDDAKSQIDLLRELLERPDTGPTHVERRWDTMMSDLLNRGQELTIGDTSLLLDAIHQDVMGS